MNSNDIHIITPQGAHLGLFRKPWRILFHFWNYRDLIRQFTWREVVGRYKGSILGLGWSFIRPLMMLLVYTFVFSVVFKAAWGIGTQGGKGFFALTAFTGIITYNVFAEVAGAAPTLMMNNVSYVKKVVFPLEILIVVKLLGSLIHGFFSLLILMLGELFILHTIKWTFVYLPIVWFPMILLALGVGFLLASLGVFLRDINHTVEIILMTLFFLSPIFYPISALPVLMQKYCLLNPIAVFVENSRRVLVFGEPPMWGWTIAVTCFAGLVCLVGFYWFMKSKKAFADVI
jgi:lipopolysaccharide transport system permease protein